MRAGSANSAVSSDHIGRIPEGIFVGFPSQHTLRFKSHEKDCNVFASLWTLYYGSVLATEVTESTEITR